MRVCDQGGGRHSLEEVYKVLVWSLGVGALGKEPVCRHDQSPFHPQEQVRTQRASQSVPFRFVLLWLKGDWGALANYYGLPSWSSTRPCFLCRAEQGSFKTAGCKGWLAIRLENDEFFAWAKHAGKIPGALLSAPGPGTWSVALDWMHPVDLGVVQDIPGGCSTACCQPSRGATRSNG